MKQAWLALSREYKKALQTHLQQAGDSCAPIARRLGRQAVALGLETLDLAKLRLVTLERTNGAARVLPALYAQSWSLQGEPSLDFSYLTAATAVMAAVPPYVKE